MCSVPRWLTDVELTAPSAYARVALTLGTHKPVIAKERDAYVSLCVVDADDWC